MLLSADIFDRTHDSRNSWEELSVSPLGDFGLKRAFPSSLTKLIGSELDTAPSFSFDANRLPAAAIPSLSLESLALGVFLEEEDEPEFSLPYHHDDTVLEFDGKGQLLPKDSNLPVLPQQSEYYGDLFLSWEDDPFAVLPVVTEKPTEEVTSPSIPLSPTFSSTVDSSSDSSDSSDSDSSSSSDSESDCAVQRRRNAKRNRGDAPRPTQRRIPPSLEKANKPRTPSKPKSPPAKPKKAPIVNPETPIKRRRRSVSRRKSPNTPDLSVEIVAEISTSSHDEESSLLLRTCPTPKKGKIGLLSTSTHELSAEAIRNIFKAEQVVTLSKTEDEDDEEVDIL